MNKRQLEVEKAKLEAEAKELKHLKGIYKKASDDISEKIRISNGKINVLLKDFDKLDETQRSILQSQIYQRNFQQSLKKQIDAFTKELESKQYESVSTYLKNCYTTGFTGTLYDLAGQGVPFVFPIDQKKVTKAMVHDTKLSKSLYNRLGEDVNLLKKRIANNISRGIATADSYINIARNIANGTSISINNTMRIARTEGHRIQCAAAYDVQHEARDAGADIVKQWDATLDGHTRETHAMCDGEIVELDETFSNGLEYPGDPAGDAEEVINCRCALLQRAKWALDDEFTKRNNFTGQLETFQNPASYAEFKQGFFSKENRDYMNYVQRMERKYGTRNFEKILVSMRDVEYRGYSKKLENNPVFNSNSIGKHAKIKMDTSNYSDVFISTKAELKNTQTLVDYVNKLQGADKTALELFNSIGKIENFNANGIKFSISHGKNHELSYRYNPITGKISEVKLTIPKLSGNNLMGQVQTTLHEQMHLIDMLLKSDPTKAGEYFGASFKPLKTALKNTSKDIGKDIKKLFDDFHAECKVIEDNAKKAFNAEHDRIKKKYLPNGVFGSGADYNGYKGELNKIKRKYKEIIDYENRNALGGGINQLEDIYDALSGGTYRDRSVVKYGHGSKYYTSDEEKINEIVANYGSLSVTRPDLINMLKKDKPELVKALDKMLEEMEKKV